MALNGHELGQRLGQCAGNAREGGNVRQRKRGLLGLTVAAKVVGDVLERIQSPGMKPGQSLDRSRAVVGKLVTSSGWRQGIPSGVRIFQWDMAAEAGAAGVPRISRVA